MNEFSKSAIKLTALLLLVIVAPWTLAQENNVLTHESVYDNTKCFSNVFQKYDTWLAKITEKMEKRKLPPEELMTKLNNFKALFPKDKFEQYKASIDCEDFIYKVGDVPVWGFVIKPKKASNLPVIVYNRGGNGNYGAINFGHKMLNLFPLAEQGFVIVGSYYRGTFQRNPKHIEEFGGVDVNDVLRIAELSKYIEGADPKRMGLYGSSRGGMQTFLALKHLKNVKAVATIAAMTDLGKGLEKRPEMEKVYKKLIPNYEANKERELEKRSVTAWVGEISKDTPILLLHGSHDKKVPVEQSTMLAELLEARQQPHKLIIYKGDSHGLTSNKDKGIDEITKWFKTHI